MRSLYLVSVDLVQREDQATFGAVSPLKGMSPESADRMRTKHQPMRTDMEDDDPKHVSAPTLPPEHPYSEAAEMRAVEYLEDLITKRTRRALHLTDAASESPSKPVKT